MNPTILKQGVLAHHLCYYKNEINQYDYYVHADDIENSNEEDDVVDETTTTATIQQNIVKDTIPSISSTEYNQKNSDCLQQQPAFIQTDEYLVNQLFTNAKLEVAQYINQIKKPIRQLLTTTFKDMYNYIFESVEDIYIDSDNDNGYEYDYDYDNDNSNDQHIIPFYVSKHTEKCQIVTSTEITNNDNQNV